MMSFVLKLSITFSILYDCVTCDYIVIDIMLLLHIMSYYTSLSKFKIIKLSLSSTTLIVTLSSIAMTLLLLRNNCISLHQSSNCIQLLSNNPQSETMLFNITIYAISLCTTRVDTIDISVSI